jgi:hypothetical protein
MDSAIAALEFRLDEVGRCLLASNFALFKNKLHYSSIGGFWQNFSDVNNFCRFFSSARQVLPIKGSSDATVAALQNQKPKIIYKLNKTA